MNLTITSHIESHPDVCGGKACITGTRVRVQDVYVWHDLMGLSADEIVSRYPHVTPAGVYAALSFYWDHRDEIQRQMQEETGFVEAMKERSPSPLVQKLAGQHAANDSLPS